MKDSKGNEIRVGDQVRFATWGMFDVYVTGFERNRKITDPEYVTHTSLGRVHKILDERNGSLYIIPSGNIEGVIHLVTKPIHNARPEFIEVIKR